MVERKLGRGLDYFLSGSPDASADSETVMQLEVGRISANPFQPRKTFPKEELEALAASIRSSGVLQPVLVRAVGDRFQLIAGERRWRASQLAGLERIPAIVRSVSDDQASVFALVENLHREDLNPIDKALAFQQIHARMGGTLDELARQVGLERSTVSNLLRLLDLPEETQALVSRGTLSMGQARAILGVDDPEAQRLLGDKVVRERMSVRQVEALVQEMKQGVPRTGVTGEPGASKGRPLWVKEVEETLTARLGARVTVKYGRKRSKITIECAGREHFERVYGQLKHSGD